MKRMERIMMNAGRFTAITAMTAVACLAGGVGGCATGSGGPLVLEGAVMEKLATGFRFTEGPARDPDGNIWFTDIPNNRIHIWNATDGTVSVARENSGGANGLRFNAEGFLVACEGGNGLVSIMDSDFNLDDLVAEHEGKPFNSPNDCWIDPKGGVYFTDPRYGDRSNLPQGGEHVYYLPSGADEAVRVADDLTRPNGIIGTPDGKLLYIADHGAGVTWRYKISGDGTLKDKTKFADSGSDGMTMDERGNVYLTTDKVTVYNPDGMKISEIIVPERPANCAFGGPNRRTLFITAQTSLYGIRMNVAGQ